MFILNKTEILTADCLKFFLRVIKTIHFKNCNKTARLKYTEFKF